MTNGLFFTLKHQPNHYLFKVNYPTFLPHEITRFDQLLIDETDDALDAQKHLIRLKVLGSDQYHLVILTITHGISDGFIAKRQLLSLLCEANKEAKKILETPQEESKPTPMPNTSEPSPQYIHKQAKRIYAEANEAIRNLPPAQDKLQTGLRTVKIAKPIVEELDRPSQTTTPTR